MLSIQKVALIGLALTILCFTALVSAADFCHLGSFTIDGKVYCQPVRALQYANTTAAGTYRRIVSMNHDGSCTSAPKACSGPLAPLDEEGSYLYTFRGPMHIKQFAVYVPLFTSNPDQAPPPRRAPMHPTYVPSPGHIMEHLMGQIIPARVDGRDVLLFKDFLGIINTDETASASSSAASATSSPRASHSTSFEAKLAATTTTRGGIVGRVKYWFCNSRATGSGVSERSDGNDKAGARNRFGPPSASSSRSPASRSTSTEQLNAGRDLNSGSACDVPGQRPLLADTPPSPTPISSPYKRISYYSAFSETSDNLVFLGNHGSRVSGVFDNHFGSPLSHVSSDGTQGAVYPQILADTLIPSGSEVIVISGKECKRLDCRFIRPNSVSYRADFPFLHLMIPYIFAPLQMNKDKDWIGGFGIDGFGGADKIFLVEFSMPIHNSPVLNRDMPAIWFLNAQIPRTTQYGPVNCS
ncbi:hypothetical protein OIDMADRAFT_57434 [Oidiodendron maius Zn]|uniref:glucan endo-1,3-beta-D-glucosidase n=1 Tax=Oidiodendron maius (strain Zn) TaxID=913774 RepID=A0A0C3GPG2_OIDMZ|nr:hypothetical protein OIDMADRAFT_57434 [Oidiodendron maius Zn]